ncbi:MAG TPA: glycosyltransferase family A protein [Bacilli bacterium]
MFCWHVKRTGLFSRLKPGQRYGDMMENRKRKRGRFIKRTAGKGFRRTRAAGIGIRRKNRHGVGRKGKFGIKRFIRRFRENPHAKQELTLVANPAAQTVAAIVTLMNEEQSITAVLDQLQRLPLHEIVVVINGSTDESFYKARKYANATIIHYPQPLGYDVGRAVGAKMAQSDILLFVDGDIPIPAERLVPFVHAIAKGMDVALNDISPYVGLFHRRDHVSIIKEFTNRSLGRPDLGINSLTAVPHALSRRALDIIGFSNLMVPPKAQASAILQGLKISMPASIDVITRNRMRGHNVGMSNPVSEMIVGDHIEALNMAMAAGGERLSCIDTLRKRWLAGG